MFRREVGGCPANTPAVETSGSSSGDSGSGESTSGAGSSPGGMDPQICLLKESTYNSECSACAANAIGTSEDSSSCTADIDLESAAYCCSLGLTLLTTCNGGVC